MAEVITGWIMAAIIFILWCTAGNSLYCYYRLRKVQVIQKRFPNIIILVGILSFIYLTLNIPLILLIEDIFEIDSILQITNAMVYIIFIMSGVSGLYFQSYRAFRLYFDVQFNHALQDREWRSFIDPKEKNWFIKNKRSWGNGKKIAICLIITYSVFTAIGIHRALTLGVDTITRSMMASAILTPLIMCFFIFYKYPVFHDAYWIRREIKISTLCICMLLISYCIIIAVFKILPSSPLYLVLVFIGNCVVMVPILVSIILILIKYKLPWNICSLWRYFETTENVDNVINEVQSNEMKMSMIDILQNENGFNLFARHLNKEFCIESLLFFIETQQWINYVLNKIKTMHINEIEYEYNDQYDNISVVFPSNAPKSDIIQNTSRYIRTTESVLINTGFLDLGDDPEPVEMDEKDDELPLDDSYIFAVKIFIKYIINKATFCINISAEEKNELYKKFSFIDSMDITEREMIDSLSKKLLLKELVHVFDESRFATFKLMLNGFSRFKVSNEFIRCTSAM